MKQDYETGDVLDLGCVSTDTKGSNVFAEDSEGGMRAHAGLTED